MVAEGVEQKGRARARKLANDGGDGRARGLHARHAEQPEDEHRVQHDVGQRADHAG